MAYGGGGGGPVETIERLKAHYRDECVRARAVPGCARARCRGARAPVTRWRPVRYLRRVRCPEAADEVQVVWDGVFNLMGDEGVTSYCGRAWCGRLCCGARGTRAVLSDATAGGPRQLWGDCRAVCGVCACA